MALTAFQRDICRLIAENRIQGGESYIAGGGALNELLGVPRRSRDLDLFHDTQQALTAAWQADRASLGRAGYEVTVLREGPAFVLALIRREDGSSLVQWARESAYRFFPLLRHDDLGLVLHPFDLATSKVLALVGRVEPRDYVDTLACHREIQPFGYLAWAACGKDPGFGPAAILERAARSVRYTATELAGLDFEAEAPDAGALSREWRSALDEAREMVALLPAKEAGRAVLTAAGSPFRGKMTALREAISGSRLIFHEGRIGGAFPRVLS